MFRGINSSLVQSHRKDSGGGALKRNEAPILTQPQAWQLSVL